MEHSALHALLLIGFFTLLGGPLLWLGLLRPAARSTGLQDPEQMATWSHTVARWTAIGALVAAGATFLDFFIQATEIEGQTIFAGADLRIVGDFVTQTNVGRLGLARLTLLLLAAAATRLQGGIKWPLIALPGFAALFVTGLVSHAAAQPTGRSFALVLQIAHLAAVTGWIGILLQLFCTRGHWLADPSRPHLTLLAEMVRRFSPIALACSAVLAVTGVIAAFRFLHETGALFTSAYGITLLVKLTLLGPVVMAGFINYRTLGPQLQAAAIPPAPLLQRFARNLELEVTGALLVLTVAGILGSISPPSAEGDLRLTSAQTHALLRPSLPATSVQNWDEPEDPRGPTLVDLRYSEFTHNWSGVLVSILGLGWLLQSSGERLGRWAGRAIALLLVAFGLGIALAANPEIWLLRTVSPWEMFTNPLLLEHQLGAALVFILAWLSWRDLRRPAELRPLGRALPIIMIAGSLLLLGHAHSTSSVPEDLSTLINVQHAFFGTCGLFAGTIRWLQLRRLIPASPARFLWPLFVLLLGLYMTFFYQEAV